MAFNCPALLVSGQAEKINTKSFTPLWAASVDDAWMTCLLIRTSCYCPLTPLYITYLPLLYYTERVFCESNNFPHDQIFAWRNSIDLCTLLNALDYLDFPGHVISIMPTRNHIFLNNNWHCTSSHSTWPVPRLSHYFFFRKRNSNFSSRFMKWRRAAVPTFPCSYF